METLNNMAAAAAKAVFGDSQTVKTPVSDEPVSGKMGDVSKGEPYDAGNMDPPPPDSALRTPATESAPATETAPVTEKTASTTETTATTAAPTTDTSTTATTETSEAQKPTATTTSQVAETPTSGPKSATTTTTTTTTPTTSPDHPEAAQPSSDVPGDSTAAQNDMRAPEDPTTNPEDPATRAKQDVDNSASGLDDSTSPDNINGPGPRPVAELAKERGGDAGAVNGGGANGANGDSLSERKEGQKEDDDGLQKESTGEDTGEKWVHTTGLHADGGNFDAAVAGAGREAERIREDKGLHHEAPGAKAKAHESSDSVERKSNGSGGSGGSRDKPKLLERIKAKLPHHHKKQEA